MNANLPNAAIESLSALARMQLAAEHFKATGQMPAWAKV